MLLKRSLLDAIAAGKVSLVFRRWKKPTVKEGGRLRTAVGELAIEEVQVIQENEISARDAALAGYASKQELLEELKGFEDGGMRGWGRGRESSSLPTGGPPASSASRKSWGRDARASHLDPSHPNTERKLYRIRLHLAGPDQRKVLRGQAKVSKAELDVLRDKLDRLDAASQHGPWTRRVLKIIAERPQVLALDLAKSLKLERAWFKAQVRKLKELGLTESLRPGYRLSPRGEAVLAKLM